MLFRGDDIDKRIHNLSGGERARVAIAQILIDKPNVLIMDEPTNHLDINSCEALERALTDFPGTVICVSHDRYFLDKVAQRLLILEPPDVVSFDGNYTAWTNHRANKAAEVAAEAAESRARTTRPNRPAKSNPRAQSKSTPATTSPASSPKKKSDNPWARPFGRLSVAVLEKQIAQAEAEVTRCQTQLGDADVARDPRRSRQLVEEHDAAKKKLRELEEEYFARSA
jgi:ATP-binding cassette subfamily F protein 3